MQEKCNFSCSRPALQCPTPQQGSPFPARKRDIICPDLSWARCIQPYGLHRVLGCSERVASLGAWRACWATVRIVVLLAAAYRWGMIKTAHLRSKHNRVVGGGGLGRGMRKGGTTCKHSPEKTALVRWVLLAKEAVIPALRGEETPKLPPPCAGHRMLGRTREELFPLAIGSIPCASCRLESMCQ